MQIQINTGHDVEGSVALTAHINATVKKSLHHLEGHLTRVEVHLDGENTSKGKVDCRSCTIEARPKYHQSMIVRYKADTLHQAVDGAARRLKSSLKHLFGRLENQHRRPIFGNH